MQTQKINQILDDLRSTIVAKRKASNKSIPEFARLIGIPSITASKYESGLIPSNITVATLISMGAALGIMDDVCSYFKAAGNELFKNN